MRKQIALTVLIFIFSNVVSSDSGTVSICDNGKYKIQDDIDEEEGVCNGDPIIIHEYLQPAGMEHCQLVIDEGQPQCMNVPISYSSTPPSSGDYRLVLPRYGEYNYLPPQRWIHSLKFGAVVFLYHPCAPADQVMTLKNIAKKCLRKHIISSYPSLQRDKPFAMVSLGCSYIMSWVDVASVKTWIINHALRTHEYFITQDGLYDYGLIEPAAIVSTLNDSVLCPLDALVTIEPPDLGQDNGDHGAGDNGDHGTGDNGDHGAGDNGDHGAGDNDDHGTGDNGDHGTGDNGDHGAGDNGDHGTGDNGDHGTGNGDHNLPIVTNTTCNNNSSCHHHVTVTIFIIQHPLLITIIVLSLIVALLLIAMWICCCGRRKVKHPPAGRYKPMTHYFHRRNDNIIGIAIPEVGLPKTVPSEREKLLLESDEDEL